MRDWANWALDTAAARGATYADVRVLDARYRNLSTKNGTVGNVEESESLGLGIRVIAEGAWGFASTDQLTRENIEQTAARAVAIARASARVKKADVVLAPEEKIEAVWRTPLEKDPFAVLGRLILLRRAALLTPTSACSTPAIATSPPRTARSGTWKKASRWGWASASLLRAPGASLSSTFPNA